MFGQWEFDVSGQPEESRVPRWSTSPARNMNRHTPVQRGGGAGSITAPGIRRPVHRLPALACCRGNRSATSRLVLITFAAVVLFVQRATCAAADQIASTPFVCPVMHHAETRYRRADHQHGSTVIAPCWISPASKAPWAADAAICILVTGNRDRSNPRLADHQQRRFRLTEQQDSPSANFQLAVRPRRQHADSSGGQARDISQIDRYAPDDQEPPRRPLFGPMVRGETPRQLMRSHTWNLAVPLGPSTPDRGVSAVLAAAGAMSQTDQHVA